MIQPCTCEYGRLIRSYVELLLNALATYMLVDALFQHLPTYSLSTLPPYLVGTLEVFKTWNKT